MSNEILDALKETPETKVVKEDNSDKFNSLENMVASLSGKIDMLTKIAEPKVEPKKDVLEDYDSDTITADQVLSKAEQVAERLVESKLKARDDRDLATYWNSKCDQDFAAYDFHNKSSKFYRETQAEVQRQPNKASPDLVYNAAARVLARGINEGWVDAGKVQTVIRERSARMAYTEGSTPRSEVKKAEIDPSFIATGKRMGLNDEAIKRAFENQGKRHLKAV